MLRCSFVTLCKMFMQVYSKHGREHQGIKDKSSDKTTENIKAGMQSANKMQTEQFLEKNCTERHSEEKVNSF